LKKKQTKNNIEYGRVKTEYISTNAEQMSWKQPIIKFDD